MPGEALRLGPFVGGLNTSSDASTIADVELVDCVNFELGIDGALKCRPPIQTTTDLTASWTERIYLLGVAVFSGTNYIIGSNVNGVYRLTPGGSWTLISSAFQARCMVQYSGKVWLPAAGGTAGTGGNWDPSGGFTSVAALPRGDAARVFKERLFIAPGNNATSNESRLTFSDAGNFSSWPGSNFIDVRPGDGQKLIDLAVYKSNLLLFKEDSTDVLAYDANPTDAVRENISTTIGATRRRCVAEYEDSVYVYHEGDIFEIINYNFTRLNTKVPFVLDTSAPSSRFEEVFLSVVGDRLIVRYFNRIYVYGLRTRTWTRWQSASTDLHNFGPFVELPSSAVSDVVTSYYAGSSIGANEKVYVIKDGHDATTDEEVSGTPFTITCSAKTKNFDLAAPQVYKRLYWWGADVLTKNAIVGKTNIVTVPAFETLTQEDFEDASLNITITNGGNLPWARTSTQANNGAWSLKSGAITHSQSSDAIVDVPAGATKVSFWYRVSSENTFDWFRFLIGANQQFEHSGLTGGWLFSGEYDVTGQSNITFRYIKDPNTSSGEDAAYVDDVQFRTPNAPVSTTVAATGATIRTFAKFLQALRFRQINFEIELTSDGTTNDGPAQLFTMTIIAATRQVVTKATS